MGLNATHKRRQCREKRRYRSEGDAREVIRAMKYRKGLEGCEKLHAYWCEFCRGWHVGKDGKR